MPKGANVINHLTNIKFPTWIIGAAFFLIFFGFGAAEQFFVPIFAATGGKQLALSALLVLYITFSLGGFAVPYVFEKLPLKKSLIAAGTTYALFVLAMAVAPAAALIIAAVLIGFGAAFLWSSPAEYITQITSEDIRGKNLSIPNALSVIGRIVGTGLVTVLLFHLHIQTILILLSTVAFLGVCMFFFLDERRPHKRPSNVNYLAAFKEPLLLMVFPLIALGFFVRGLISSGLAVLIAKEFGLNMVGVISIITLCVFVGSTYVGGAISDKYGRYPTLLAVSLLYLIGSILIFYKESIVLFTIGVSLGMVYDSVTYPVINALIGEKLPEEKRSYGLGFFQVATAFGVVVATVVSMIFETTALPWVIFSTAIGAILWLLFTKNTIK